MRGKPILLTNCDENIDNVITPLIHHRNTAEENDKYEGMMLVHVALKEAHKPNCKINQFIQH